MYSRIFKDSEASRKAWLSRSRGAGALGEMYSRVSSPDGGFTYQPVTSESPKDGFAVSPYADRSFAKKAEDFGFDDLVDYAVKNKDLFENPDHFLGAWHDPASGTIFLDVSIVTKKASVAEALSRKHDQIAYFDLAKGSSVTVNANATSGGVVKEDHGTESTAHSWLGVWRQVSGPRVPEEVVRKSEGQRAHRRRAGPCRNSIGII